MDTPQHPPDVPLLLQRRYPEQFRSWLQRGAILTACGYCAAFFGAWLSAGTPDLELALEPVVIVICLLGAWLGHKGRTQAAAWLILTVCWVEIHLALVTSPHGLRSASTLVLLPLVLGVALLLGRRVAFLVTAITGVTVPVCVVLAQRLVGCGPGIGVGDLHYLLSMEGALLTTLAVVVAFLQTFSRVLFEADTHERRVAALVERSPDGLIGVSESGRISTVNPAATSLFGLESQYLIGQPLSELCLVPLSERGLVLDETYGEEVGWGCPFGMATALAGCHAPAPGGTAGTTARVATAA
jgi:PAS domain-containing protein